jgi:hypothetical protein
MTPLHQQLEDKKKGCGEYQFSQDRNKTHIHCGDFYMQRKEKIFCICNICKVEIAILEQAIAEMQKQRQEEIMFLVSLNHDLKECNIENVYPTEGYRIDEWIKKRIKELNQPKTEE